MILRLKYISLAIFGLGNLLQANSWEDSFNQEQLGRLEAGEVVFLEPEEPYFFTAAIEIEAPKSMVWDIMLDHERVLNYVKDLRSSQMLEKGENWKIVEHRLKVHALLPQFYYVFREEYDDNYAIEFESVRGAFRELKGCWKLLPGERDDRVVLMYSTFVDVGWYIPKSWIKHGINKRVPALLNAFREEVYSDLRKSKTEEASP